MMKPLRRVDEETLTLLNGIEGQGNALSDDLASASAGIQVHEQFDRSIEDVIGRLDALHCPYEIRPCPHKSKRSRERI